VKHKGLNFKLRHKNNNRHHMIVFKGFPVSVLVSVQDQKWSQSFILKQFVKSLLTYFPLIKITPINSQSHIVKIAIVSLAKARKRMVVSDDPPSEYENLEKSFSLSIPSDF
jgi:hypothetical protein